ncbi:MAG TPA: DUF6266 family protein, partial [Pedobacter sp.]|nr:DUF6266 family protein [Pedobacter sp.]
RIKNGIIGAVSGSVGPVVGSIWKGIPYLRSKPERKKRRKKSAAEIATTTSFGFLSKFLKPFQPYLKIGFMHYAAEQTERNAAHAANHNNQLIGPYPDLVVDYSRLILSKGDLPGILNPVVSFASGTLHIQWEANLVDGASGSDQIMLTVYDKISKTTAGFVGAAQRAAEQCVLGIGSLMLAGDLELYIGLTSWDRSLISGTQYLGNLVPAEI